MRVYKMIENGYEYHVETDSVGDPLTLSIFKILSGPSFSTPPHIFYVLDWDTTHEITELAFRVIDEGDQIEVDVDTDTEYKLF